MNDNRLIRTEEEMVKMTDKVGHLGVAVAECAMRFALGSPGAEKDFDEEVKKLRRWCLREQNKSFQEDNYRLVFEAITNL